jgi:hypothetical protein
MVPDASENAFIALSYASLAARISAVGMERIRTAASVRRPHSEAVVIEFDHSPID